MALAECQELRDRKLNELMESIADLEREAKERREKKKQRSKQNKSTDEIEVVERLELEGESSNENDGETNN